VLLNKSDAPKTLEVRRYLQPGIWRDGFDGSAVEIADSLRAEVPAHGVRVFLSEAPIVRSDLRARLDWLMAAKDGVEPPL